MKNKLTVEKASEIAKQKLYDIEHDIFLKALNEKLYQCEIHYYDNRIIANKKTFEYMLNFLEDQNCAYLIHQ